MKRPHWAVLAAASTAIAGSLVPVPPASAADGLTCFDRPATIVGTAADDTLTGTAGDDVIVGLDGRDFIDGREGDDVICAGANPVEGVPKYGASGDLVVGGAGNDLIAGGPGMDELLGGPGDDALYTGDVSGDDSDLPRLPPAGPVCFIPGNGIDGAVNTGFQRAEGGDGDDALFGSSEGEQLWGDASIGSVAYDTPRSGAVPGDDTIHAGAGPDCVRGGPEDDTILGGKGDDQLKGNAGRDVLLGQAGADVNHGGSGSDHCLSPSRRPRAHSC
jgi:Ca2+-binding RTX toxin-like protein